MDNHLEPPTSSWMDIKYYMYTRLVLSYYRSEILLKLQILQQGGMCVNEYFKLLKSFLMKTGLHDGTNEVKVARFMSDLRKDIQDIVELYEYSSLGNVLHLEKIEA